MRTVGSAGKSLYIWSWESGLGIFCNEFFESRSRTGCWIFGFFFFLRVKVVIGGEGLVGRFFRDNLG